jgi:hypothetical protein|tara:strand:- start:1197 stop:1640 length:444 start_codon:yes stop_codon:yes gene_type:complete
VVEETEEQKLEKEKLAIKEKIEGLKAKIEQYQGKCKLCQDEKEVQDREELRKKTTDLVEKGAGDRKFLKDGSEEYANGVLGERRAYNFVEMVANKEDPNGDEEPKLISINGACCRTPAEDLIWEEEQKNIEAAAPKGGKAPAKGKKK